MKTFRSILPPSRPNPDCPTLTIRIGHREGLGNQMFEIAGALAIARELRMELRWIWEPSAKRDFGLGAFGLIDEGFRDIKPDCPVVDQGSREGWEANLEFVRRFKGRECVIWSRFQSEECFEDIKDEVRALFGLPEVELPHPEGSIPIAVHVRRGDYVNHGKLQVCTLAYYTRSIAWFRSRVKNPHFIVVSDDPKWCQTHFRGDDTTVMPLLEPIEAMKAIRSCKGHIISNSTFGWWGAWLGEYGPVIVPSIWFRPGSTYNTWNPVPDRWIKIPVGSLAEKQLNPGAPPRSLHVKNQVLQRVTKAGMKRGVLRSPSGY